MHDHDRHYQHAHHHSRSSSRYRLALTLGLAAIYMVAEIIGGLWTGSLALLADAGHMFSDVASLALSLFAAWVSERPPTSRRTYGFYRTEILAAMVNGATLVAIAVYILFEAYHRFRDPREVIGPAMLAIAVGGLAVNLLGLWLLSAGRDDNLNVRGAWLHVLTDALGSVGAIAAGALIWGFGWQWADPLASVLIAMLVIYSSWRLLAEAVAVLMESAPHGIDVDEVRAAMGAAPGVVDVHDLHVWSITSGLDSLSAHVVIEEGHSHSELLTALRAMLDERFGIDHVTIQIEPVDFEERYTHF